MTNVKQIAKLINIDSDLDLVSIGKHQFDNCSNRPTSELSQWLYCVLHAGNSQLLQENEQGTLREQILQSVGNKKTKLSGVAVKLFGVTCVNIGGVRVLTKDVNSISVSKCRPNLTPGFFMYMDSVVNGELLSNTDRYYIYAKAPVIAIEIWNTIIEKLEKMCVPFSTKVLSQSSSYPRTDAVVVYTTKEYTETVRKIILEVSALKYPNDTGLYISPLCKPLSNVVSFAEQPKYRGKNVSFGESRCEPIAYAIKDSLMTGLDFQSLLKKRFENSGINPNKIFEEL